MTIVKEVLIKTYKHSTDRTFSHRRRLDRGEAELVVRIYAHARSRRPCIKRIKIVCFSPMATSLHIPMIFYERQRGNSTLVSQFPCTEELRRHFDLILALCDICHSSLVLCLGRTMSV